MGNVFDVGPEHEGQRVDNFLLARLRDVPRSKVYKMIRSGEVRVNKGRVRQTRRLLEGDQVRIPPWAIQDGAAKTPRKGDFSWLDDRIVYEDEELLVLDKPAGLAVHGGSGVSLGLIEALRAHRPQSRFLELVHRLDRDTSGLIMVALKRRALVDLHERLRGKGVDKRYVAILAGEWPASRQSVREPLLRMTLKSGERIVRVDENGQAAHTRFRLLESFQTEDAAYSSVEASPMTGRTHQIRVHCWHFGTPIIGDAKYGVDLAAESARKLGLNRMALHAAKLRLPAWKGGEDLHIEAPQPAELSNVLNRLRK